MKPDPKLRGLCLAGGRSSRMGCDKAALVHPDGRPLARRTCDLLREAGCWTIVLSLRHDQKIPDGFEDFENLTIARDPAGGSLGPLVGLVGGMRLDPSADCLVFACDLPNLDLATLTNLVSSRREGEKFLAYRSASDGLPEPLCALYTSESFALMDQALTDNFHYLRGILIRHECRLLDLVSPRALDNANTPEDWAYAIAR